MLVVSRETYRQSDLDSAILSVFAYFDIFSHPLTKSEIADFVSVEVNDELLDRSLRDLCRRNLISSFGDYFGIGQLPDKVRDRRDKNELADGKRSLVLRFSKLISSFPFVRSVCITGSYSKGVMSHDSDLDFFIITAPQRLWFTKMLMVIFRKLFLFDSHKNFCINYFITSANLLIEEQNQFTAIELATMIPAYGPDYYKEFMQENRWVYSYFPNLGSRETDLRIKLGHFEKLKSLVERLCQYGWASSLDRMFMELSRRKYIKKYGQRLIPEDFEQAIRVSPEVAKVHPQYFQKQILESWKNGVDHLVKENSAIRKHE